MKLSIVIASRNDDYMGNSNWRLETTVNFIADSISELKNNNEIEIIIIDWGSKVPLHQELNLSNVAILLTRFIIIPENIIIKELGDNIFADNIAINLGIRRSTGDFVGFCGNDFLWTSDFFRRIYQLLDGNVTIDFPIGKVLMVFPRKHIPWEFVKESPPIERLQAFIKKYDKHIPLEPLVPFQLGSAGSLIMHRDLWLETRGLDEKLTSWGWSDVDLVFRMRLKYSATSMEDLSPPLYHLQHYSSPQAIPVRRKMQNPKVFNPFVVNGPDWGFGDKKFEEHPPIVPLDVSHLKGGDIQNEPQNYKMLNFMSILKFTFTVSPLRGLGNLKWFLIDCTENRLIKKILSLARIPRWIQGYDMFEKKISGPWEDELK